MANKKIFMLVGSILLGALAGFALLGYVRGVEDDVLDEVTRVPVFVVSGEIAEGTTAQTATSSQRIVQSEIESQFRPASAITDLSQIAGQIAAADLVPNQVLVQGHFGDPEVVNTTFAGQIREGHVAFSLTIPKARAVNGFVKPGDFVDIIVLGDAPVQVGEENAFESSLAASPYESPARTLFRGVRIESINNDVVGGVETDDEVAANGEDTSSDLQITFSIPSSAAQRLLSVNPSDIVLGLLPPDWTPEQQENEVLEAIITDEDLPGEDPALITPYGADGFIDSLAEDAAGNPITQDSDVEEVADEPETLEPAPAPETPAEDAETEEDDQ